MMRRHAQALWQTGALYPVTACWTAGVLVLVALSKDWLNLGAGLAAFASVCVLVLSMVTHRQLAIVHSDLGVVHELVNSQRTALVDRIDALIAALTLAGVAVPVDPEQAKVTAAMRSAKLERSAT